MSQKRIIVAMTGATGAIFGIRFLEALQQMQEVESHLIISKAAMQTIAYETDWKIKEIKKLANCTYNNEDIGAAIASGSFKTHSMVILPCSVNTLSAIAHSISDKLIHRAADVILKERRRLVMALRETPLHSGHLKNMLRVTQMGAIVAPPVPAFYHRPKSVDDIVNQSIGRFFDLLELDHPLTFRWKESIRSQSDDHS